MAFVVAQMICCRVARFLFVCYGRRPWELNRHLLQLVLYLSSIQSATGFLHLTLDLVRRMGVERFLLQQWYAVARLKVEILASSQLFEI